MFHPSIKSSPILLEACSVSFETDIVSSIEVLDNKRKNDAIKKLVSRMPFLIEDYTEEEKRTELVCVNMGYYLTEHYVYNPRNDTEKKKCVDLILSTPFRNKIYDMQLWLESIIKEGPELREDFLLLIALIDKELSDRIKS